MSRSKGAKTFWSGSHYDGEMVNGKRHGHGVKAWPNGDKYEGEWRFDKKDGRGTMSEAEAIYEGEWRSGVKHGKGVLNFTKGESYEGEWENDQAHGKGIFRKKNGNVYEGEYQHDKCHGYGTYKFTNGDKYEGEWKAGLKSGQGTISWSSGRKFEGRFSDDCPILGELTECDGKVYRVTYDGNRKFSRGAEPETQELLRTASGTAVGEVNEGVGGGVLAPSLEAAAAKMRAASTPDSSPPVVKRHTGNDSVGEANTGNRERGVPTEPRDAQPTADAAVKGEWDPFAEISSAIAPASVPATAPAPQPAQGWDPFGEKPPLSTTTTVDASNNNPFDSPAPSAATVVGTAANARPQLIESAIELSSPIMTVPHRGGRPSPPGQSPNRALGEEMRKWAGGAGGQGEWDSIMQKAQEWGNRNGSASGAGRPGRRVPLPASFLSSEVWAPVDMLCPLTLQVLVDPVRAPDGVVYERDALARWQETHSIHASPCAPDLQGCSGCAAGDMPRHAATRDKVTQWHGARSWDIDRSRLTVLEQDVLGKGAWGVVKLGRLSRSGGGEDVTVAVKMWPTADAALAKRLWENEAGVYKAAAGCCRRVCVMHGTSTINGRGVLVLQHCSMPLIGVCVCACMCACMCACA